MVLPIDHAESSGGELSDELAKGSRQLFVLLDELLSLIGNAVISVEAILNFIVEVNVEGKRSSVRTW